MFSSSLFSSLKTLKGCCFYLKPAISGSTSAAVNRNVKLSINVTVIGEILRQSFPREGYLRSTVTTNRLSAAILGFLGLNYS
ncbi:hypothetical protein [Rosenbergiella collisarenosi]|uniref:hypothetical protein n=1 Tax=Rosenbergiella collisarenosi TaxID=1544695 RepID=UPI001F4F9090|nr:hypothetical protein [Rosenbergiella collisarenosi]